jgi:hypothetical protein
VLTCILAVNTAKHHQLRSNVFCMHTCHRLHVSSLFSLCDQHPELAKPQTCLVSLQACCPTCLGRWMQRRKSGWLCLASRRTTISLPAWLLPRPWGCCQGSQACRVWPWHQA